MRRADVYRRMERMTLVELRREKDALGALIRDIRSAKQSRIRALTAEIERREQGGA